MLAANTFPATSTFPATAYGDFSAKAYNDYSQYVQLPQMQQMQMPVQQMAPMPDCGMNATTYRHDPYAAPPGGIPSGPIPSGPIASGPIASGPIATGPIPEAPSCMQTTAPTEYYWSTPYEYAQVPCATQQVPQQMQQMQPAFAAPQQEQVPQQAFAKAWYVPTPQPAYQMVQTEIPPPPPVQKPKEEIQEAPASIFDGCRTKAERRKLAILVITKGLQQGKNRTYGAARRKMTKWAQLQGICKEDLQLMVEYLNELCLAGATYEYDAAGVPASRLAVGVSENAVGYVSHLLSADEMWEGCLNYITPAECHARRGKKDEQA